MRATPPILAGALLLAACGGAASPSPAPEGFAFRMWVTQALPPVGSFDASSPLVAIDDGLVITHGPVPAIFPGPLLPNLVARPISPAGIAEVLAQASRAGLLAGPTDLTDGVPPGGQVGHLLFVVDGEEREVFGDPSRIMVCIAAPCDPAPATPEAFGGFWARMSDPASSLGPEVGSERPYAFERMAVLLREPALDATLPPQRVPWPLGRPGEFGVSFHGEPNRCGVVEGDDVATLVAAFQDANAYTRWTDDAGAEYGAVARPLLPGEADPCGGGG